VTNAQHPLADTHAHLTWPSFSDVPEVLLRARASGVTRILTAATDLASCVRAVELAGIYPEVYAAVGIHPNDVRADDDPKVVAALTGEPRVVAIGETGLDYYRDHTDPQLQRRSLDWHLALAERTGLPVILHDRAADEDLLAALAGYVGRVRGVLHCFSGDRALAGRALDLGYYLSFAGNLTYPSAAMIRDVAGWAPAERILSETDAPFLSPVPLRGKRNEPAYVAHTVAAIAAARGVALAEVASILTTNAAILFGWAGDTDAR